MSSESPVPTKLSSFAEKSLKEILDYYNRSGRTEGVGNYCAITSNGSSSSRYIDNGCFGSLLAYESNFQIQAVVMHPRLADNPRYPPIDPDSYQPKVEKYIDWLTNHSVFAPVFLEKNPKGAFSLAVGGLNQTFVGITMSMARYSAEYANIIEGWAFLEPHVGPKAAFIAAHLILPQKTSWSIRKQTSWCDHIFMHMDKMTPKVAQNFINDKVNFTPDGRTIGNSLTKYSTHSEVFYSGSSDSNAWELPEIKSSVATIGWLKVQDASASVSTENVVDYVKELFKLNGVEW